MFVIITVALLPWRRKWQLTLIVLPENPVDRKTSKVTVHRVTKSQTGLKQLSRHSTAIISS